MTPGRASALGSLLGVILSVFFLSCGRGEETRTAKEADEAREKIKAFWRVYGEASQLRTAGMLGQAVEKYREALEGKPDHEDSLYYFATTLAELGEYGEAVQTCARLVALNPASHRGFLQLGMLLSTPLPGARLDFERAENCFLHNVEINREESGPFLRLGTLALSRNRIEEARKHFDTAAGFQSPEGMFLAGALRFTLREFAAAKPLFQRILEINAREKKISGRGVHSEGDIQFSEMRLTPLEQAGIQALVYLYWTSAHLGGYAVDVPAESRLEDRPRGDGSLRFQEIREGLATVRNEAQAPLPTVRDLWDRNWSPVPASLYALADLDGDGVSDRLEYGNLPEAVRICSERFSALPASSIRHPVVALEARDFDGDAVPDILLLEWKGKLRFFRNAGKGRWEDRTETAGFPQIEGDVFAMTSLDYDNDGLRDLLLVPHAPYATALLQLARSGNKHSKFSPILLRNLGRGRFQELPNFPGLEQAYGAMRAVAADFDQDGYPDLLIACGGLQRLRLEPSVILHNVQGRAFALATLLPSFANPLCAWGADAPDFDNDGYPDVRLRIGSGIKMFRNLSLRRR